MEITERRYNVTTFSPKDVYFRHYGEEGKMIMDILFRLRKEYKEELSIHEGYYKGLKLKETVSDGSSAHKWHGGIIRGCKSVLKVLDRIEKVCIQSNKAFELHKSKRGIGCDEPFFDKVDELKRLYD